MPGNDHDPNEDLDASTLRVVSAPAGGTAGADVLRGTSGDDVICGLGGDNGSCGHLDGGSDLDLCRNSDSRTCCEVADPCSVR